MTTNREKCLSCGETATLGKDGRFYHCPNGLSHAFLVNDTRLLMRRELQRKDALLKERDAEIAALKERIEEFDAPLDQVLSERDATIEALRKEVENLKNFDALKRYKTLRAVHQSEARRIKQVEKEATKDRQRLVDAKNLLAAEKERAERLELELIVAKGMSHDGTVIWCEVCKAEGTELWDEQHEKGCRYIEARKLLAEREGRKA